MNKAEMAKVLTIASAIDNRKLSSEAVEAWFMVVGDIDYEVAVEAVRRHFDESSDYLVPNHVRVISQRIMRDRIADEKRSSVERFVALRERLIEEETVKVNNDDPDADFEKLMALSRGEWRDEWVTGKELQ